jgi:hypothetical protein
MKGKCKKSCNYFSEADDLARYVEVMEGEGRVGARSIKEDEGAEGEMVSSSIIIRAVHTINPTKVTNNPSLSPCLPPTIPKPSPSSLAVRPYPPYPQFHPF